MRKKNIFLIVVTVLLLSPVLISYFDYRMSRINNDYEEEFTSNLNKIIQEKDAFQMTDVAKFDWDRMYMFQPYTSRDEMEKIIGTKWISATVYPEYLIHKSSLGKYPLDDDSLHKLVFVNEAKVVLDITLNRYSVDFAKTKGMIERSDSTYAIDKTGDKTIVFTHLTKEK